MEVLAYWVERRVTRESALEAARRAALETALAARWIARAMAPATVLTALWAQALLGRGTG